MGKPRVWFLVPFVLAGCSDIGGLACTAEWVPGIVVEITDAETGLFIAEEARGTVRDGTYVDSLVPHGSTGDLVMTSRQAAHERPGEYMVRITHEGYEDWVQGGVAVREDRCHVLTEQLRARMTPVK